VLFLRLHYELKNFFFSITVRLGFMLNFSRKLLVFSLIGVLVSVASPAYAAALPDGYRVFVLPCDRVAEPGWLIVVTRLAGATHRGGVMAFLGWTRAPPLPDVVEEDAPQTRPAFGRS
jgi:hypothetical protein